jgi:hypothetical protein
MSRILKRSDRRLTRFPTDACYDCADSPSSDLHSLGGPQTLLGATGTGKTFVMANVIARFGRPALVLAPNKMLAAQLCRSRAPAATTAELSRAGVRRSVLKITDSRMLLSLQFVLVSGLTHNKRDTGDKG